MVKYIMLGVAITVLSGGLALSQKLIFTTRGIHPAVSGWYYLLHRHAFDCDPLSGDPYGCEQCPVGARDRVVAVPDKNKAYDVPTEINAWFACEDINTLVPAKDAGEDSDVFICEHKPPTGFLAIDGWKIDCSGKLSPVKIIPR